MPGSFVGTEKYFVPVATLVSGRPVPTCTPDTPVRQAAGAMSEAATTALVVLGPDGKPVGAVSVRGFRDLLASGEDLSSATVASIMAEEYICVPGSALVFEAILAMVRHNVHRVVVLDAAGALLGVLSDTDVLQMQTRTPLFLHDEIEKAPDFPTLRALGERLVEMLDLAAGEGANTRQQVRLLNHYNDTVVTRVLELLAARGQRLPDGCCWLALGSEGRREQTLRTDQDNALLYDDRLGPEGRAEAERFAAAMVSALEDVGVPRCHGGVMAINAPWRGSLSEWSARLERWSSSPTPEHLLAFGTFYAFRPLGGDKALAAELRESLKKQMRERGEFFFPHLARHIYAFQPPVTLFGRLRLETKGEHRGQLQLKKAGLFALSQGVGLLALEAGLDGITTWEKLDLLAAEAKMPPAVLLAAEQAFTTLMRLRLRQQIRQKRSGAEPSDYVSPLTLEGADGERLDAAVRGTQTFLKHLHDHFRLAQLFR